MEKRRPARLDSSHDGFLEHSRELRLPEHRDARHRPCSSFTTAFFTRPIPTAFVDAGCPQPARTRSSLVVRRAATFLEFLSRPLSIARRAFLWQLQYAPTGMIHPRYIIPIAPSLACTRSIDARNRRPDNKFHRGPSPGPANIREPEQRKLVRQCHRDVKTCFLPTACPGT